MYTDILEKKGPFNNSMEIIKICMEEAEKEEIAGDLKLKKVLDTIQNIIETKPVFIKENCIKELLNLENSQLINIIEAIITASKGFYYLNKKHNFHSTRYVYSRNSYIWG
jgi:hypothetical protein